MLQCLDELRPGQPIPRDTGLPPQRLAAQHRATARAGGRTPRGVPLPLAHLGLYFGLYTFRERAAANREHAAANRERASADRERAAANRERAAANRERAAANRERAVANRERVAANRERAAAIYNDIGRPLIYHMETLSRQNGFARQPYD